MKFISILALLLSVGAVGAILYRDLGKTKIARASVEQSNEGYSNANTDPDAKDELLKIFDEDSLILELFLSLLIFNIFFLILDLSTDFTVKDFQN